MYDRGKAVAYAHRWAFERNPAFLDFDGYGGDCTNFVSQCVYAGCGAMNYTPTFGWYYISPADRAPAWSGVEFLRNFLVDNSGAGPYGKETDADGVSAGDVVQLSFDGERYAHTALIVEAKTADPQDILIAAHTNDSDYRKLSTYGFMGIRFIKIIGARLN